MIKTNEKENNKIIKKIATRVVMMMYQRKLNNPQLYNFTLHNLFLSQEQQSTMELQQKIFNIISRGELQKKR